MTFMRMTGALALLGLVSACGNATPADKSVDRSFGGNESLSNLVAGVWVDPNGCDHWIIDDGVEGYLSERLTPDGRPVCSGVSAPTTVVGPFKSGGNIQDPVRASDFQPSGRPLATVTQRTVTTTTTR